MGYGGRRVLRPSYMSGLSNSSSLRSGCLPRDGSNTHAGRSVSVFNFLRVAYESSKEDTKAPASLSLPNRHRGFYRRNHGAFEHRTGRDIYPMASSLASGNLKSAANVIEAVRASRSRLAWSLKTSHFFPTRRSFNF